MSLPSGDPLPHVDYTAEEKETWHEVYTKLKTLYPQHACAAYLRNLKRLEDAGLYSPEFIPQLGPIDMFLNSASFLHFNKAAICPDSTGFRLRPCGGLLSARDFLASLAMRCFQATIYVRHHKHPHHSPEPLVPMRL